MTAAYFATVGDYAEQALESFVVLLQADEDARSELDPVQIQGAAIDLVRACLSLLEKFPTQAQISFSSVIPFTQLEMQLLGRDGLQEPIITHTITRRLVEWATRSPVFVDEANVHAIDFLTRLVPLLDLWDQRQLAIAVAERILRGEGNADYYPSPKNAPSHLTK